MKSTKAQAETEKLKKTEFLKKIDLKKIYIFQYTWDCGWKIAIYDDGSISSPMTQNTHSQDESDIVFYVCGFVGQHDESSMIEDFCEVDRDTGKYRKIGNYATGEEKGKLYTWYEIVEQIAENEAYESGFQDDFTKEIDSFFEKNTRK